ncbi:MAG: YjgN family protein [Endozoicomonas sp.]
MERSLENNEEPFAIGAVHHDFEFSGKAGEFFRIWIVNLLLTIVTLGIYSAWAKVRTKRYFYGSTRVAGSAFSYLASPITILKGRLIALAFMVAFSLSAQSSPILFLILMLALLVATPWVIARSLAFNARMSAWRNVRFRFDGGYGDILINFLLLPIVVAVTLGLTFPWMVKKQKECLVRHYSFGGKKFEPSFTTGDFYKVYLLAFCILCLTGLLALVPIVGFVLAPFGYLVALSFVTARQTNLVYGKSRLDDYSFVSRIEVVQLAVLYLTNFLAIVFTLGLATPWAMIRTARYRLSCITLVADESLDSFTDKAQEEQSALGEELGEVFDIAVGI